MGVEAKHPEYSTWLPRWRRCVDFVAGEDDVKAAGVAYLPKLDGQSSAGYRSYLARAGFFNGTGLAVQQILGSTFRRDPVVDLERFRLPRARSFVDDVDLAGTPLVAFAEALVKEQVIKGRVGLLVDYSTSAARALLARYPTESIVNWSTTRVGGDEVLTLVVLADHPRLESADGGFTFKERQRRRVLRLDLDPNTGGRVYSVEVWEEAERENPGTRSRWFIAEPRFVPMIRGRALDRIPFWFVGSTSLSPGVEKPPILDLVNVNWHHYLLSADHDHGLHWVSLPTPWVSMGAATPSNGEGGGDRELFIGSSTAWELPPGSKVGMLEMRGPGMASQVERLLQLERQMHALGLSMMVDKAGVEAADTARLRAAARSVTIADIVGTAELALNQAIDLARDWMNLPAAVSGTPAITLNRQFTHTVPTLAEVSEARAAYAAGHLPWQDLVGVHKRAGLVEANTTPSDLQARIARDLRMRAQVSAAA